MDVPAKPPRANAAAAARRSWAWRSGRESRVRACVCIHVSLHLPSTHGEGTPVQLTYDEAELLASHDYEAPLIAGGVRCHGGFDADGAYVSPRTKHRAPAIANWQANHEATFGTELMGVPLDTWPG